MVISGAVKWPEKSKRYDTKVEIRQIDQEIVWVHRDKTRNPEMQCKLQLVENAKITRNNSTYMLKGR